MNVIIGLFSIPFFVSSSFSTLGFSSFVGFERADTD